MSKYLKLIIVISIAFLCLNQTFCQDSINPKDGYTYAQAFVPNQFKAEPTLLKITPSIVEFVKQEAIYDTITMGLMAHSKKKELLVNIYDFEIIGEKLTTSSGDVAIIDINEEFNVRNDIKEKAVNKWSLSDLALCDSPQNDCDLFDWVELPIKYSNHQLDLGKSTAKDNQLKSSVAFFNIRRKDTNELIPVEYFFYTKIIEVQSEKNLIIETPATYEMSFHKIEISDFLKKEWVEVVTTEKIDKFLIQQIQLALKGRNKYKGPINGIWSHKTQAALENFQIENKLYVGQLDKETMEQLGFNFSLLRYK